MDTRWTSWLLGELKILSLNHGYLARTIVTTNLSRKYHKTDFRRQSGRPKAWARSRSTMSTGL